MVLLSGCARDDEVTRVDGVESLMQDPAADRQISEEEAQAIVARVTDVAPDDVTVMDRAVNGSMVTILAGIPADEKLLPHQAGRPGLEDAPQTEQQVEAVRVRWNVDADALQDVLWSHRLQFAEEEPVTPDEAFETARELKARWFPEVPAEMVLRPPHRLHRPSYVVAWHGKNAGVRTGDEAVAQISAVTGLPIAYSQRVATQRPDPDEIPVTRDEALEAVRALLIAEAIEGAEAASYDAELILSSTMHPAEGPAWIVQAQAGRMRQTIPVDAMTGEALVTLDEREGDDEEADGEAATDPGD
jgi:hypothetical protein